LQYVDGAMIGRAVCDHPYLLAEADGLLYGNRKPPATRTEVLLRYKSYMQAEMMNGTAPAQMSRHLLGLFRGQPGARAYRRILSTRACMPNPGIEYIDEALGQIKTA